jgi:hypothetical protein
MLISRSTDEKLKELLRHEDIDRYFTPVGRETTFNLLVSMAKTASLEEDLRLLNLLHKERFVNCEHFRYLANKRSMGMTSPNLKPLKLVLHPISKAIPTPTETYS